VSVTFASGGKTYVVEVHDGETMRRALVEFLSGPGGDALQDRDLLLRTTRQAPVWIDGDKLLRVGAWLLDPTPTAIRLRYRLPPTPLSIHAYVAQVAKVGDDWKVETVRPQIISAR
jgi:hypothetical protein